MEPILIPCEHCEGTGKVKLLKRHQQVYEAIVANGGSATTRDVIAKTCPWASAQLVHNRLQRLLRLGLIENEKIDDPTGGFMYLWKLPEFKYEAKDEG